MYYTHTHTHTHTHGLSRWLSGKESACQCRRCQFDPWVWKTPGEGNESSSQYSCLGNPMDRGAWQGYRPWGRRRVRYDLVSKQKQHYTHTHTLSLSLSLSLSFSPSSEWRKARKPLESLWLALTGPKVSAKGKHHTQSKTSLNVFQDWGPTHSGTSRLEQIFTSGWKQDMFGHMSDKYVYL